MAKYHYLLVIFLIAAIACTTPAHIDNNVYAGDDSLVIEKIVKKENNVYIIYAIRNDSIFKIASHFNGTKNKDDITLKKGSRIKVKLHSQFRDLERKLNIIPMNNASIEYFGVTISKEPEKNIDDVFICDEINGKYLSPNITKNRSRIP